MAVSRGSKCSPSVMVRVFAPMLAGKRCVTQP